MPRRFYWIDSLRGLAALAVLLSHYAHFYLRDPSGHTSLPAPDTLPYGTVLAGIYAHGALAVPLFWMISGFVFLHVYLDREVSARSFVLARFARLYPMHAATLIAVSVLQIVSLGIVGHEQIYGHTDLAHFSLNLLLASHWTTLSGGLSFNGPIWSVSLEILVYALFFLIVCRGRLRAGWALTLLALGAGFASQLPQDQVPLLRIGVLRCACFFFAGAAFYKLLHRSRPGALLGLILCLALSRFSPFASDLLSLVCLGGALLLLAALFDVAGLPALSPLRRLGDISYSLYLVHVPLQMLWLLNMDFWAGGARGFADHALTLPAYVLGALALASLCHRKIERPAQKALLDRFARGPALAPGWVSLRSKRSA